MHTHKHSNDTLGISKWVRNQVEEFAAFWAACVALCVATRWRLGCVDAVRADTHVHTHKQTVQLSTVSVAIVEEARAACV